MSFGGCCVLLSGLCDFCSGKKQLETIRDPSWARGGVESGDQKCPMVVVYAKWLL